MQIQVCTPRSESALRLDEIHSLPLGACPRGWQLVQKPTVPGCMLQQVHHLLDLVPLETILLFACILEAGGCHRVQVLSRNGALEELTVHTSQEEQEEVLPPHLPQVVREEVCDPSEKLLLLRQGLCQTRELARTELGS